MLLEILSVIAPLFVCSMLGFGWVRMGRDFDTSFISHLVTGIGAPCLIYSTFMTVEVDLDAFKTMAGATLLSMTLFTLIGTVILRALQYDLRAFLPSQIFPNVGNMGLPLCLLAFGNEGLALALTYFMVNVVFQFTVGNAITAGTLSLRDILRNPMFIAVVLTLICLFTGIHPPAWIQNTTELLGGITIPLMLVALGVSLARFRIKSLKRSLTLSLLRLVMGFLVGVGVAELMGFQGVARGILIVQCAMPVAVFSYLFAVRYNREPEEVAGTVVLSTVLSFLSLPLLLWYVLPQA
jgi:Predicted permeases